MRGREFRQRVEAGAVVPLSASEWDRIAPQFPEVERHNTQLAGDLIIVRVGERMVAVESPSPGARVARLLGDPEAVRAFVDRRMEEYERMWDGCGVRVDYLEP